MGADAEDEDGDEGCEGEEEAGDEDDCEGKEADAGAGEAEDDVDGAGDAAWEVAACGRGGIEGVRSVTPAIFRKALNASFRDWFVTSAR